MVACPQLLTYHRYINRYQEGYEMYNRQEAVARGKQMVDSVDIGQIFKDKTDSIVTLQLPLDVFKNVVAFMQMGWCVGDSVMKDSWSDDELCIEAFKGDEESARFVKFLLAVKASW